MEAATQTLGREGVPGASIFLRALGDKALVKLASNGSDDAFTVLYQRHQGPIFAYCVSILRDYAEAEDALHEVMFRTHQVLQSNQREIAFKPWLFRCARNHCLNVLQRRSFHDQSLEEEPIEQGGRVEDVFERQQEIRALLKDVSQLPEDQRTALLMREASGLSHLDIAEALDIDAAKAKRMLFEARRTLSASVEGREMACAEVRFQLSEGDGRTVKRRDIRSHLKACESCQEFKESISERRSVFAAGLPILGPEVGLAILAKIFAGASAAKAAAGGLASSAGSGAVGSAGVGHGAAAASGITGKFVGAGLITKGVAVVGASAVIATGGVVGVRQIQTDDGGAVGQQSSQKSATHNSKDSKAASSKERGPSKRDSESSNQSPNPVVGPIAQAPQSSDQPSTSQAEKDNSDGNTHSSSKNDGDQSTGGANGKDTGSGSDAGTTEKPEENVEDQPEPGAGSGGDNPDQSGSLPPPVSPPDSGGVPEGPGAGPEGCKDPGGKEIQC